MRIAVLFILVTSWGVWAGGGPSLSESTEIHAAILRAFTPDRIELNWKEQRKRALELLVQHAENPERAVFWLFSQDRFLERHPHAFAEFYFYLHTEEGRAALGISDEAYENVMKEAVRALRSFPELWNEELNRSLRVSAYLLGVEEDASEYDLLKVRELDARLDRASFVRKLVHSKIDVSSQGIGVEEAMKRGWINAIDLFPLLMKVVTESSESDVIRFAALESALFCLGKTTFVNPEFLKQWLEEVKRFPKENERSRMHLLLKYLPREGIEFYLYSRFFLRLIEWIDPEVLAQEVSDRNWNTRGVERLVFRFDSVLSLERGVLEKDPTSLQAFLLALVRESESFRRQIMQALSEAQPRGRAMRAFSRRKKQNNATRLYYRLEALGVIQELERQIPSLEKVRAQGEPGGPYRVSGAPREQITGVHPKVKALCERMMSLAKH